MRSLPRVLPLLASAPVLAAQTPELETWYRLDETSGSICADSALQGHDGVYDGGTLGQPGAAPGTGTSVLFDGVGDKVDIPDGPGFTALRQELSAVCWMNPLKLSGVQRFFGNDGSWTWGLTGSSLRFTTRNIRDYDLSVPLNTGTWYHIAAVFDANFDVLFYVDGQFAGTVFGSSPANAPKPTWHIAYKDPGNPEWFDGHIDDIQVYDGVLSPEQVKYLYDNPGDPLGGPLGTNYCGPANLNSTGQSALISAWGNESVALNDLQLTASLLPPNEIGFFLASQTPGFVITPPGTQGNLCLGGRIGRFVAQLAGTGAAGELVLEVDLTQLPMSPPVAAQAGETWHFQAWFTDQNPGPTSNFTDGIALVFQ